jgi:predicted porin
MKKLLAIAVAAALVAPAAAMADTTLYGKLHASVGAVKTTNEAGTTSTSANVVESHSSRIGIKGATALDNGMEATYGMEYGIDLDGDNEKGSSNVTSRSLNARNTFVGLKGGFGEVRVGRHDTPAKLATAGQDVFADTYGDMSNIITTDGDRVDNAVAYINKFGPVGFAAAHATDIDTNSGAAIVATNGDGDRNGGNNANTFMVNYGNGPWYAALGHTAIQNTVKKTNLGLGYKVEAGHQVNFVMENAKDPNSSEKTKAALINGVYKMGNVALKAQYGESKNSGSTTATDNGKEKLTSIGADYNLGKKTAVYLLHSDNKNTNATTTGKARTKATAIGLVTQF